LAAVLSAEQGDAHAPKIEDETPQERMQQTRRVVLTFAMQGVGFLAVPLVTVPLLNLTDNLNLVWRLVLGFGSLPGLLLVVLQWRMYRRRYHAHGHETVPQNGSEDFHHEHAVVSSGHGHGHETVPQSGSEDLEAHATHENEVVSSAHGRGFSLVPEDEGHHHEDVSTSTVSSSSSLWASIWHEPHLIQKLLGTAGTWFLFDVLFYGNTLFEPIVMETAFGGRGGDDVLKKAATDSLILACIALPGYIISAFVMGKRVCYVSQTPRFVQMQGFVAMSLLYAVIGAYWSYLKRIPWLLVLLYGSTFFFANYGPNTTTFVFPSLVYSPECRSTLNGISAAAGKAGALLGATMFEPVSQELGDDRVMLICAGVSVLAFAMTHFFVRIPPVNPEV
jgi:PHS family inorganic phosphate transporter-like MFS transporter